MQGGHNAIHCCRFKHTGKVADMILKSTDMNIQLICPNLRCRKFLSVPDEVRGRMVKCLHCQTQFRVPEATKKKPGAIAPITAAK